MKYSKILLCMTALFCLAFQAFAQDPLGAGSSGSSMGSSGDWISPNMGQVASRSDNIMGSSGDFLSPNMGNKYPRDWLEGGYVRSHDRSMMDPGIAGMLRWLDAPVSNFPWYSADLTFYKQAVPDTTFSPFREYYTTTGTPVVGGIISNPTKFDITKKAPSSVLLRCRCRIAILPVCSRSAIQDQRPLDPGSNELDTICGKPSWNLAAAGSLRTR